MRVLYGIVGFGLGFIMLLFTLKMTESPYLALVFGEVDYFYELKTIPGTVDECFPFHEDETAFRMCCDVVNVRLAREMKHQDLAWQVIHSIGGYFARSDEP